MTIVGFQDDCQRGWMTDEHYYNTIVAIINRESGQTPPNLSEVGIHQPPIIV